VASENTGRPTPPHPQHPNNDSAGFTGARRCGSTRKKRPCGLRTTATSTRHKYRARNCLRLQRIHDCARAITRDPQQLPAQNAMHQPNGGSGLDLDYSALRSSLTKSRSVSAR